MTLKATGWLVTTIGVLLLSVGFVLGLTSVHRDGIGCGAGLTGVSSEAKVADFSRAIQADYGLNPNYDPSRSVAGDCQSAVSDRKTISLAALIPGGILAVVGFAMAGRGIADERVPTQRSIWT